MELFVVLTLVKLTESGTMRNTLYRTVTAAPGSTRAGMLVWAMKQAPEHMQGATVEFFSVEPNLLTTPACASTTGEVSS